jgi:hypothetical protein
LSEHFFVSKAAQPLISIYTLVRYKLPYDTGGDDGGGDDGGGDDGGGDGGGVGGGGVGGGGGSGSDSSESAYVWCGRWRRRRWRGASKSWRKKNGKTKRERERERECVCVYERGAGREARRVFILILIKNSLIAIERRGFACTSGRQRRDRARREDRLLINRSRPKRDVRD